MFGKILSKNQQIIILEEFEKLIKNYSYKIYTINEKEKVFEINNDFVLYVGFLTYDEYSSGKLNCEFKLNETYFLKIEEITYNSVDFKFDYFLFKENCKNKIKEDFYFINYLIYFRKDRFKLKNKINLLFPELKLKEKNKQFKGVIYYIIFIEITSIDGKKGIGGFSVTQNPHIYMVNRAKNWIKKGFYYGNMNCIWFDGWHKLNKYYSLHLEKALNSYKGHKIKRQFILENYLKYFYFVENVFDKDEVDEIAKIYFKKILLGEYQDIPRSTYKRPVNRWVTEELLYNLIKKIYKDYKVIYQYKPSFLKGETGGQMSYDIFIVDLNLAIEYQGKQHFESINFFGGEKSLEYTKKRDKLKKELSIKNNIRLVYINYWEKITVELIKAKIEQKEDLPIEI